MNLARVSQNGQITVPVEVRHELGLKSGDKILFFKNNNGEITIKNASIEAIDKFQKVMSKEAKKLNLEEEDIQNFVNETRYGEKAN